MILYHFLTPTLVDQPHFGGIEEKLRIDICKIWYWSI